MSSKVPISRPTISATGISSGKSELPTSPNITPSSSTLSESSSSTSSLPYSSLSSALGSLSAPKATNVSWNTATRIRITLFIVVVIVSCCLLTIANVRTKNGGSKWMEEALSGLFSFLAFPSSATVDSTSSSRFQLVVSSPPRMVILLLSGFLILDLLWLHPDAQLRTQQKLDPPFSKHEEGNTTTTATTTITATARMERKPTAAAVAAPFMSLDAMEDGLTLLFLLLVLGSADQTALATMNGTMYAIMVKMALKVTWHTATNILNGGGSSSSWNWMDTTSNVFDSSPPNRRQGMSKRNNEKDAVDGMTTTTQTEQQKQKQQQEEQERSVGKLATHSNLWLIHGQEYNLADFVHRHPGGKEAILLGQGRDCTALFESYHSFTKQNRYVTLDKVVMI
jgi:cytochrome b involved in lipid metabolism